MLKGHVFSKQLFGNPIFALFINTFLNGTNGISSNFKNSMGLSYSGSTVTVQSGAVCIQGRFLEEDTSTSISAGTENAFCKLVIEVDLDKQNTENDFQQGAYKIIKGASNYVNLTQNNIVKNNSGVYQYELARFKTTSSGITDFKDMRTFLNFDSIYSQINSDFKILLNQIIEELNGVEDRTGLMLASSFHKISGAVVLDLNSEGNYEGQIQIDYPANFNLNNSSIISVSTVNQMPTSVIPFKTQGTFSNKRNEYNNGHCEYRAVFYENEINIFFLSKGNSNNSSITINYEIVLFKSN